MKKLQTYLSGIAAVLLAALGACTDDDKTLNDVYLETDASYYSANARGLTTTARRWSSASSRTPTGWSPTTRGTGLEEPWFTLAREGGNGSADLAVTVQRNDGNARSAELKLVTNRNVTTTVTLAGRHRRTGSTSRRRLRRRGAGSSVAGFDGWNLRGMGIDETYHDGQNATLDAGSPGDLRRGVGRQQRPLRRRRLVTLGGIAYQGRLQLHLLVRRNDTKAPSAGDLKLCISQDRVQWTPVEYTLPASAEAGKMEHGAHPVLHQGGVPGDLLPLRKRLGRLPHHDPARRGRRNRARRSRSSKMSSTTSRRCFRMTSWANNAAYVKSDA